MSINILQINATRFVFVNVIYVCYYYLYQAFKICHNFFIVYMCSSVI